MHGVNSDTGTLVHWVHVTTTDSVHGVNSDTGTLVHWVHVTTTDSMHGVNSDTGTLGTCHHNRLCARCK